MARRGLAYTGVPSKKELKNAPGVPAMERLNNGAIAVLECLQIIPCNPCEAACPLGAITIGKSPNLPHINEEKCVGCGLCIPHCPGLAIFVVDMTYSKSEALVSFPYEFQPLPSVGMEVNAVNREGKMITRGRVTNVKCNREYDHTAAITIVVPKELAMEVRSISFKKW